MKSSELIGSFSWQSANLPGSDDVSKTFFLLVSSLAFLAASLALAASIIFDTNFFASPGVCSSQALNCSEIIFSTTGLTSDETNLSFVCDENLGSGTLTDNTHVIPSLASSPDIVILPFFETATVFEYPTSERVSADRKPCRCVPPSPWGMLFVKHSIFSLYPSFHCKAPSTLIPLDSPLNGIILFKVDFLELRN